MRQKEKGWWKVKNNEEKVKNKIDKRKIFGKFMAAFMLVAMVLASCSTCIYYVVSAVTQ